MSSYRERLYKKLGIDDNVEFTYKKMSEIEDRLDPLEFHLLYGTYNYKMDWIYERVPGKYVEFSINEYGEDRLDLLCKILLDIVTYLPLQYLINDIRNILIDE